MTAVDDNALGELIEQARQGDGWAINRLIERADHGDMKATGELCKIASRALYSRSGTADLNDSLRLYLAASLSRVEDGGFALAFATRGPQPAWVRKARKEMNALAPVIWVNRLRSTQGLKTSKDGEPGLAFAKVGKMLGLAPATVRNRYYAWKNSRKTPKPPKKR